MVAARAEPNGSSQIRPLPRGGSLMEMLARTRCHDVALNNETWTSPGSNNANASIFAERYCVDNIGKNDVDPPLRRSGTQAFL